MTAAGALPRDALYRESGLVLWHFSEASDRSAKVCLWEKFGRTRARA
jgi:hypothetical protein